MTQSVNSLLSGENCLKQRKSTYDKRFIRYHKCFLLKLRYGAHANPAELFIIKLNLSDNSNLDYAINSTENALDILMDIVIDIDDCISKLSFALVCHTVNIDIVL